MRGRIMRVEPPVHRCFVSLPCSELLNVFFFWHVSHIIIPAVCYSWNIWGGYRFFSWWVSKHFAEEFSVVICALEMTCLMLCRRAATDLDAEPAAAEPTFPRTECLSQVSAAERSPKKGCCFLLPPQKPGKQSLSGAAGFSHQYNILWEPEEDCARKGCSQELVETHLRVCSTNKG